MRSCSRAFLTSWILVGLSGACLLVPSLTANLREWQYNPDFLNRYTSRGVPRYVQSIGTANSSAPVWLWSINGLNTLTSRKGTYFWGELFQWDPERTRELYRQSLASRCLG